MKYHVSIQHTETILLAVEAGSPEEAENLAFSEGDEISCSKVSTETVEVRPCA